MAGKAVNIMTELRPQIKEVDSPGKDTKIRVNKGIGKSETRGRTRRER